MMRAIAVALPIVSIEAKLAEVNARLQKGQGWIGYRYSKSTSGERCQSRFLYYTFYQHGKQKFVFTANEPEGGTNDPEEAYRRLLKAHNALAEGNRLPSDVAKLRYEYMIERLIEDWKDRGVTTLYQRRTKDGKTEWTFGGKDDMDRFFKSMSVLEITALKIDEFIRSQRKQGYADPTIRKQLNVLSAAFSIAKSKDLITDNHIPTFNLPSDSKPRERFLEIQDFDKFVAAFPDNLQPSVIFLYYTGCRSGAAEKITWGMVNNDCTEIHAPGAIIKNKEAWEIPLVGPLEPLSDVLKRVRKQTIKENKILATDAPVFDFTNFRKIWNQTCHDFQLGTYITEKEDGTATQRYSGLHAHDFRRSAARNLVKAGLPEHVAMKITGHKTTSMFRRYAIQNTKDVKEALIKVGEFKKGKTVSITAVRQAPAKRKAVR